MRGILISISFLGHVAASTTKEQLASAADTLFAQQSNYVQALLNFEEIVQLPEFISQDSQSKLLENFTFIDSQSDIAEFNIVSEEIEFILAHSNDLLQTDDQDICRLQRILIDDDTSWKNLEAIDPNDFGVSIACMTALCKHGYDLTLQFSYEVERLDIARADIVERLSTKLGDREADIFNAQIRAAFVEALVVLDSASTNHNVLMNFWTAAFALFRARLEVHKLKELDTAKIPKIQAKIESIQTALVTLGAIGSFAAVDLIPLEPVLEAVAAPTAEQTIEAGLTQITQTILSPINQLTQEVYDLKLALETDQSSREDQNGSLETCLAKFEQAVAASEEQNIALEKQVRDLNVQLKVKTDEAHQSATDSSALKQQLVDLEKSLKVAARPPPCLVSKKQREMPLDYIVGSVIAITLVSAAGVYWKHKSSSTVATSYV